MTLVDIATRDDAVARAERIRAGIRSVAELQQDIADAYHARDWTALGYESWDAYLSGEFGEGLPRLGRDERRELVVSLRAEGLSTRAIASAVGVGYGTVRRDMASEPNGSVEDPAPEAAPITGVNGKTYTPKPTLAPESEPEIVDAELVDDAVPVSTPLQKHRPRIDVVRVVNQIVVSAEEAADRVGLINAGHLSARAEEAAVWSRRLSHALASLQRFNESLQEVSR